MHFKKKSREFFRTRKHIPEQKYLYYAKNPISRSERLTIEKVLQPNQNKIHRYNSLIRQDNNIVEDPVYPRHYAKRPNSAKIREKYGLNLENFVNHIMPRVQSRSVEKASMNELNNFNRQTTNSTKNAGTFPLMLIALIIPLVLCVLIASSYCLWKTCCKDGKTSDKAIKKRKKKKPYKDIKYQQLKMNASSKQDRIESLIDLKNSFGDTTILAPEDCMTHVKVPFSEIHFCEAHSERNSSQGTQCSCSVCLQPLKCVENFVKYKGQGVVNDFDCSSSTNETTNSDSLHFGNKDWIPQTVLPNSNKVSQSDTAVQSLLDIKIFRGVKCTNEISFTVANIELPTQEGSVSPTVFSKLPDQIIETTRDESKKDLRDAFCQLPEDIKTKYGRAIKNDADLTDLNKSNLDQASISSSSSSDESLYYDQPYKYIYYKPPIST